MAIVTRPESAEYPTSPEDGVTARLRLRTIIDRASSRDEREDFEDGLRQDIQREHLTRKELMELSNILERSDIAEKELARRIILEEMRNDRDSLRKKIDPRNWSNDTKDVAVSVGIGVGVLGSMYILRKAWKGVEHASERISENASKAWGTFKWILFGAIVTGGAYIGIRGFGADWSKKFEQVKQLKQTVDKLNNDLRKTPKELKGMLQKKIEELEQTIEDIETGKKLQSIPTPEPVTIDENTQSEEDGETNTETRETVKRALKHGIASTAMVMFDPEKDEWKLGTRSKIAQVQDIIAAYSQTTMDEILASDFQFRMNGGDPGNRERAGRLVYRFCAEHTDEVVAHLTKDDAMSEAEAMEHIGKMSLDEYLKVTAASLGGVADVIRFVTDESGTAMEKLERLDLSKLEGIDETMREQVHLFVQHELQLNEEEMDSFDYALFLKTLIQSSQGTARFAGAKVDTTTNEGRAVESMLTQLRSGDTHKYVLYCFHGILPNDKEMEGKSDEEKSRICLLDRMTVTQAMRCFFYGQMMKSGNPSGLALMQVEVLKFIQHSEVSIWDKMNKYDVLHNILEKVAVATPEKIIEEWQKAGLTIDEAFLQKSVDVMRTTASLLGNEAIDFATEGYWETLMGTLSTVRNYPKTAAGPSGVGSFLLWRYYHHGGSPAHIDEALQRIADRARGGDIFDKLRSRMTHIMVSGETMDQAATSYKRIYQIIEKLPAGKEKDALFRAIRACNDSNATELPWKRMLDLAKRTPTLAATDIESHLSQFVTNPSMRKAVNFVRHPWIRKTLIGPSLLRAATGTRQALGSAAGEMLEVGGETVRGIAASIKEAAQAKNLQRVLSLFKSPTIVNAAKTGSRSAAALLRMGTVVGKYGIKALPVVGAGIELWTIRENELEIEEAKKSGNLGLQQTLETKRITLAAGTAGSIGSLALTGTLAPVGWIAAPVVIGGTLYANAVYDSITTWEKTSKEWLKQSPEELLEEVNAIPVNHVTIGHRAGLGDAPWYRAWKKMTWSEKAIEETDNERWEEVEKINRNVRQEILTAYFLQTTTITPRPNETPAQLQERMKTKILDRMQYIKFLTKGTYATTLLPQRFIDQSGSYADMIDMERQSKQAGTPATIEYPYESGTHTLDLTAIDVVYRGVKDQKDQLRCFAAIKQYEDEVLPLIRMAEEMSATPDA